MPKGTRVSRCVDKVKKSKDEGAAIAICQDSTKQGYATGKALKEALAKQFGSQGSKLSRTSSRHTTNPGESKAEARDDAEKFTRKHGQQASQTHKQTGKIPGPKPGEKKVEEAIQAALVGIGRAAAGMVKKKAAKKAITSAQGVATGGDTAKKQAELGQQAASDKDLEENKMNNAYVRTLMETHGARKMTPDEREGARRLAGHGRDKPGEEGKPVSPKKRTRASEKTQAAAARAEKKEADANNAAARRSTMKDHTEYHRIGALMAEAMGLIEAHQSHIDPESKKEVARGDADAGFPGPGARRIGGKKKGTSDIKDPKIKSDAEAAGKRVQAKVPGAKPEKMARKNLVGAAMLHNRKQPQNNPPESRADARADAREDKRRRMAPGDK
jgi:hypothetical protein